MDTLDNFTKVGIYGGTFSPIHNGHVKAAIAFYEQLKLDKLFIVPTAIPPHKKIDYIYSPSHRLKMIELAFSDNRYFNKGIYVSDFEVKKSEPSYTVVTLEYFKTIYEDITFLCGTDMFLTLDSWYQSDKIFKLCKVAYVKREEDDIQTNLNIENKLNIYKQKYEANIIEVTMPPIEISSTKIRGMIAENINISKYIPEAVQEYIIKNDLYRK